MARWPYLTYPQRAIFRSSSDEPIGINADPLDPTRNNRRGMGQTPYPLIVA